MSLTCFITGLNLALCHFCRSSISSTILTKHTTAAASSTPASPQLFFTVNELKAERRRLHSRKAAGVSPRLYLRWQRLCTLSSTLVQKSSNRVPVLKAADRDQQLQTIYPHFPYHEDNAEVTLSLSDTTSPACTGAFIVWITG